MMNIHHLELFYFVARHRGIAEAVRRMPYGIQQPAVSSQIAQLENDLGSPLFRRRPFALTPAGDELFRFIEPFFANIDAVAANLRQGPAQLVRIGASTVILRDHFPDLLRKVRSRFPALRITLHDGSQSELDAMLKSGQLDLAVSVLEGKPAPGIHTLRLLDIPLVLITGKRTAVKSAEKLFSQDRIAEPLIAMPAGEIISRLFQKQLARLKVDWPASVELNSLELIEIYAADGFGIGLSVAFPRRKVPSGLRALPLNGFPPLTIGASWCEKLTAPGQALVDEMRVRADLLTAAG